MEVSVQRAKLNDATDIAPLFDAYRVFYGQPSDLALASAFVHDRLAANESVIFFARDNQGHAAGFTQLYPSFSSVSAKRSWILNDLFVSPQARRQGIARALMRAARDFAIETNAKGIGLETERDNLNAQALYEAEGYQRDQHYFSYFLKLG